MSVRPWRRGARLLLLGAGAGLFWQGPCWVLPPLQASAVGLRREAVASHREEGLRTLAALGGATLVVLAQLLVPLPAVARDGAIAPPTCVSISNAEVNCPGRKPSGALQNAAAQLKDAQQKLAAAEKEAGHPLGPGESQGGEPEMVSFWEAEGKRLAMNREFLDGLKSKVEGAKKSPSAAPVRLVSRLTIRAADVEQEAKFWCEGIGMQRYETLPGGGAVVAFGPTGLPQGDEGAYFSVQILPEKGAPSSTSSSSAAAVTPKLSFVQVATPSLIRISRVVSSGGTLVDGYGYYGLRSPAGVEIRGYVDDRRDPMEFVALTVPSAPGSPSVPDEMKAIGQSLEALGLKPKGPYQLVSPMTQAYMPTLPEGNILYAAEDPKQSVQVLLVPPVPPKQSTSFVDKLKEQVGRGPAIVMEPNSQLSVDILEEVENEQTPISQVKGIALAVSAPQVPQAQPAPSADVASLVSLQLVPF